jgi:hypothetical protein
MRIVSAAENFTVYVYYKISLEERTSALLALKKLEQSIKLPYPNLKVWYQKRVHLDVENRETWMEAYTNISEKLLENFKIDLARLALRNGLSQERRYEVFIAMD